MLKDMMPSSANLPNILLLNITKWDC